MPRFEPNGGAARRSCVAAPVRRSLTALEAAKPGSLHPLIMPQRFAERQRPYEESQIDFALTNTKLLFEDAVLSSYAEQSGCEIGSFCIMSSSANNITTLGHRPTWAEIDLDALAANFKSVREVVNPKIKVMAVVKADAYGHGAVECARRLASEGAAWFGVATPEEGIELRQAGIAQPILGLGGFSEG